jgi:hypothetical protein
MGTNCSCDGSDRWRVTWRQESVRDMLESDGDKEKEPVGGEKLLREELGRCPKELGSRLVKPVLLLEGALLILCGRTRGRKRNVRENWVKGGSDRRINCFAQKESKMDGVTREKRRSPTSGKGSFWGSQALPKCFPSVIKRCFTFLMFLLDKNVNGMLW